MTSNSTSTRIQSRTTFCPDVALKRLGGRKKLLEDMAVMFQQDAPELLDDLKTALVAGDAEDARRAAHSLKGIASTLEATTTTERALSIETLARDGHCDEAMRQIDGLRTAIDELFADVTAYLQETK